MLLSEFIGYMQGLIAQHGDHEVWLEDYYGEPIPYRAEWFMFQTEQYGDTPVSIYTL